MPFLCSTRIYDVVAGQSARHRTEAGAVDSAVDYRQDGERGRDPGEPVDHALYSSRQDVMNGSTSP